MAYELKVAEAAERDLFETFDYISSSLEAPKAASDFFAKIQSCFSQLVDNPYVYALSSDLRLEEEGYRKAVIGNYLLMFTVDEKEKCVFVHRLFYGGMDYCRFL